VVVLQRSEAALRSSPQRAGVAGRPAPYPAHVPYQSGQDLLFLAPEMLAQIPNNRLRHCSQPGCFCQTPAPAADSDTDIDTVCAPTSAPVSAPDSD
jgi:hypothetical protein